MTKYFDMREQNHALESVNTKLKRYKVNGCLICELPADVMDGFHPGGGTIEGGFMIVEPVIN